MEKSIIKKIPAINGVYGDRYIVNTKLKSAQQLFEGISLWTTNCTIEEDGSYNITYELCIGDHLEDNPLIMKYLNHFNIIESAE